MSTFFKTEHATPSWYSGRFWLLKLGYYKLTRQKEKADDWIWIVDHTVQWGKEKCLLILGIRQSNLPESETNLFHEDVEPLALFPVSQSNGDVVYQQLKETITKTGIPKQIISDHGSDVKSGIERFCQAFPRTIFTYDITHKVATLLKRELESDKRWQCFISNAAATRKKVQQTPLAAIAPPNQRSKARYMNVDTLIKWGMDKLHLMNESEQIQCLDCSSEYFDEKLGWLEAFRDDLYRWKDVVTIVKETEMFIKFQGFYRGCQHDLKKLPTYKAQTRQGKRIKSELLEFIKMESHKGRKDDRLLGSSEVIESVFGKMKRLEQNQAKSGFTVFILGIAALVAETTGEVVQKALETVKISAVNEWFKKNIACSVQAKRVEVNRMIKNRQQKQEQFFTG